MRKLLFATILLFCVSGCDAPQEAKDLVRDKHAQLYVYVERLQSTDTSKRPTQEQTEQMIKALLKDMESLDKLLNNWKKDSSMKEVHVNGNNGSVEYE